MKGYKMAAITAAMVKELREMTGAGMMECKKALSEVDGNMEAAVDVLRTRGLAAAAKKAGRATDEGTICALVADDGKSGVVLELNCETDFVGMNEKFKAYASRIAAIALAHNCSDVEQLKGLSDGTDTVNDIITDAVHVLGENVNLSRVQVLSGAACTSYIHMGGKIGVLTLFDVEGIDPTNADFVAYGRNVCMQVAAVNPVSANRESVDRATVEHERSIYVAQAAESGKPEAIQHKIAEGRLEKFFKENCLSEQDYVKNPDQTISEYTQEVAKQLGGKIAINSFVRFSLGE